jgi:hypothetical protein
MFEVVLAVQLNATLCVETTHAPPNAAATTALTTSVLQTSSVSMLAVQGTKPKYMFIASCTSRTLTTPSAFRSQAFAGPCAKPEEEENKRAAITSNVQCARREVANSDVI